MEQLLYPPVMVLNHVQLLESIVSSW